MGDAIPDLTSFVAELKEAERLPERLGDLAAPGVQAAGRAQMSAGTTPGGAAWPPNADGSRALSGEESSLTAVGTKKGVKVSVAPPLSFHDLRRGSKKNPRRQILPDAGEIPDSYADAVDAAVFQAVP
jgi:hypothetical protein